MDQLIPVVAKLHEVLEAIAPDDAQGAALALDLPCIVVVGCQSSGKSSVLEAIVQRDFLPRGRDIVTRRPLVLQLVHVPAPKDAAAESHSAPAEWAEFGHLPGTRLLDFGAVRREIEDETARVAGSNAGISRAPIHLRIYSPHVLSLTLVDLPGITKIPVGEQPADIEAVVRRLVLDYACRPNAIILAVTPANADLANSDALKIAREADPEGLRTLGVLTKLDLMDAGTHAADILAGRSAFRLRLGFVGVVCRSQHDINTGKAIRDALRHEAEFFRSHSHYRAIAHRCGALYLSRELNRVRLTRIVTAC